LWRQRNGHVVVVKKLDNDAPDLHRFRSVNCASKGWFPRGRHSLGEDNHPLDLVKFLGIVRSGDQKPNPSAPCQSAEIERLREELLQSEKRRTAEADVRSQSEALRVEQAAEIERLQAELKAERADTHRRLTTAHNNHNLHVAGLKAEHRGESAGLQTAIRLILEKLDA